MGQSSHLHTQRLYCGEYNASKRKTSSSIFHVPPHSSCPDSCTSTRQRSPFKCSADCNEPVLDTPTIHSSSKSLWVPSLGMPFTPNSNKFQVVWTWSVLRTYALTAYKIFSGCQIQSIRDLSFLSVRDMEHYRCWL
jgi:hypothetical protein